MAKYHLGDDGQPRPCEAEFNCPKGGDTPHFEGGLDDARVWAEEQNAQAAGGTMPDSHTQERRMFKPIPIVSDVTEGAGKKDIADEKSEYVEAKNRLNHLERAHNLSRYGEYIEDKESISEDAIEKQEKYVNDLQEKIDKSQAEESKIRNEYVYEKSSLEFTKDEYHRYQIFGENSADADLITQDQIDGHQKHVDKLKKKVDAFKTSPDRSMAHLEYSNLRLDENPKDPDLIKARNTAIRKVLDENSITDDRHEKALRENDNGYLATVAKNRSVALREAEKHWDAPAVLGVEEPKETEARRTATAYQYGVPDLREKMKRAGFRNDYNDAPNTILDNASLNGFGHDAAQDIKKLEKVRSNSLENGRKARRESMTNRFAWGANRFRVAFGADTEKAVRKEDSLDRRQDTLEKHKADALEVRKNKDGIKSLIDGMKQRYDYS